MPMSEVQASPPSQDWGLTRVKTWDLKLCILPKKCHLSGKKLWGKKAYKGIRWIHGPGEPIEEIYWIERSEFMFWNLRGRQ